jgi:hypothetical protein
MSIPNTVPLRNASMPSLEKAAKISTYAIPPVYLCGFVVLSLYEGNFGIADLSPVRVKALAAGILFVFFLALPSVAAVRAFQLLGLKKPGSRTIEIGHDSNLPYFYVIKLAELYMLSTFISMGLLFVFVRPPRMWFPGSPAYEGSHFSLLSFSVGLISLGMYSLMIGQQGSIRKAFAAKPKRCASLALLTSLLWIIWNFEMSDWLFFQLVGWCYLVGLASIFAARAVEKGRGLKSTDWELGVLIAFAVFVPWFATSLYGNIKPAFGGGNPVPAKLYLLQDNAVLGGKILDVLVIEETDHGYYVVSPIKDSKRAIFVPRSNVTTAEFGGSGK